MVEMAEEPFASLEARVATMLLLSVRLFEEEDADDHSARHDHRTHKIGEQVRAPGPDGIGGKDRWPAIVRLC